MRLIRQAHLKPTREAMIPPICRPQSTQESKSHERTQSQEQTILHEDSDEGNEEPPELPTPSPLTHPQPPLPPSC